MTTKAPAAPKAPTPVQVINGGETEVRLMSEEEIRNNAQEIFWRSIREIKGVIADEVFGKNAGKAGSTLKDSLGLTFRANELFNEKGIHYDLSATDIQIKETIIPGTRNTPPGPGFLAFGTYDVRWFLNGIIVYTSKTFGSFDEPSSVKAVHGALTCAKTDVLFTMLQANTKSEEDLFADKKNAQDRQAPRNPAVAYNDAPY